jgi:transposase-like protein
MDLQMLKLTLIHQIIQTEDEEALKKIDKILSKREKSKVKPMTLDEFYQKIERAEQDIVDGKTMTQTELEEEIKKW